MTTQKGKRVKGKNLDPKQMTEDFHIVVAIEFDGKQPNGTFYDRLHKLGIYSRGGNREEYDSPLARRNSRNHKSLALVFQEGFILCANRDVASAVANIADDAGASAVWVGMVSMTEFRMTESDVRAWEQYKNSAGRRGPKPVGEKGRYTVTCYQENATFEMELDSIPFNCPSCGSFHFTSRKGQQKAFAQPKDWGSVDLWKYWLATRFDREGNFEIPKAGKLAPPEVVYEGVKKYDLGDLATSTHFESELVLKAWDACYCLTKFTKLERNEMRLQVLNGYIMSGGERQYQMFSEIEKGKYDLLDLCILIPEFREFL